MESLNKKRKMEQITLNSLCYNILLKVASYLPSHEKLQLCFLSKQIYKNNSYNSKLQKSGILAKIQLKTRNKLVFGKKEPSVIEYEFKTTQMSNVQMQKPIHRIIVLGVDISGSMGMIQGTKSSLRILQDALIKMTNMISYNCTIIIIQFNNQIYDNKTFNIKINTMDDNKKEIVKYIESFNSTGGTNLILAYEEMIKEMQQKYIQYPDSEIMSCILSDGRDGYSSGIGYNTSLKDKLNQIKSKYDILEKPNVNRYAICLGMDSDHGTLYSFTTGIVFDVRRPHDLSNKDIFSTIVDQKLSVTNVSIEFDQKLYFLKNNNILITKYNRNIVMCDIPNLEYSIIKRPSNESSDISINLIIKYEINNKKYIQLFSKRIACELVNKSICDTTLESTTLPNVERQQYNNLLKTYQLPNEVLIAKTDKRVLIYSYKIELNMYNRIELNNILNTIIKTCEDQNCLDKLSDFSHAIYVYAKELKEDMEKRPDSIPRLSRGFTGVQTMLNASESIGVSSTPMMATLRQLSSSNVNNNSSISELSFGSGTSSASASASASGLPQPSLQRAFTSI